MNAELAGSRRRWIAAAAGSVVVVVVFALLVKVPDVPSGIGVQPVGPATKSRAPVDFAQTPATSEEASMHDQRPLFLPTEWNATLGPVAVPENGRTISDEEVVKQAFGLAGLADMKLSIPEPVQMADNIIEAALADAPPIPLHGFGRKEAARGASQARGGFVEIVMASTQERVLAEPLPFDARPKTEAYWAPVEFLVEVDATGLVGSLTVVERSDVEEVDLHFRNYLARTYRVGERLAPGRYRIIVGP